MKRRDLLKASAVAAGAATVPFAAKAGLTGLGNWINSVVGTVTAPVAAVAATVAPSTSPVLPQHDTYAGQLARAGYTQAQKLNYVWTGNFLNAPGIPMAATVTANDLPTVEWLLLAASTLVKILTNFIAALPVTAASLWQNQLNAIAASVAAAQSSYDALTANPNLGSAAVTIPSLQTTLLGVLQTINALIQSIIPQLNTVFAGQDATRNESNYKALFATIPLPDIANTFHRDDVFARLRVAGQNPVLIQGVASLPTKFPLTDTQYRQVMGAADDLATAGIENRLFLLDYVDLGTIATAGPVSKLLTGTGYSYAPIALFAIPKGGTSLVPVAIQCGQDPATNPIFLPAAPSDTSAYWAWQQAKTVVQCAEENYHEMFVHLSRTHFVSEAFAMATWRNLAQTHPLYLLLAPHFEGTLFINEGAALILMPNVPLGFINTLFAAPMPTIAQDIASDRLAFDFYAHMLPTDLANRKVDNPVTLPDYPYRDDGLLIWNAIHAWTTDYVNVYYASDSDVTNDYELTAWVDDVAGNGHVKGFVPITSRAQLASVLTLVIFNASAQHAAVNFSQPDLCTYAPALSALLSAPAPTSAGGQSQDNWNRMLPPMVSAVERVAIYELLGGVYYRQLGQYKSNAFPYAPLLTDPRITQSGGPLSRFQQALQQAEATINTRNQTRPTPYPYLLPSRIPASTNI
ncbi:AraC family transcriptional regulator [Burkholderia sp. AU30280]|uniref:lipoxygenase family protein n=1 Tax=Burkholderia sp. AU30280 TaxID=2879628 RepID=UPI001CF18065|nr:lipoxygenase family protein [Burkholderia sp. AU30280]MCA8271165.1 AraC family transcriptional regulator [Burkholderia sp. AU30280]